jgi:hypothetical protein
MIKILLLLVILMGTFSAPCHPVGGPAVTLSEDTLKIYPKSKELNKNLGQPCGHQSVTCKLDCMCGPVYLNLEPVGLRCPTGSSILEEETESCYGCSCNYFPQMAHKKTSICVRECMAVATTLENQADALEEKANELELGF